MAHEFPPDLRKRHGTAKNKAAETRTHRDPTGAKNTDKPSLFEGSAATPDTTVPGAFFDIDAVNLDEPGQEDFTNLGALLQHLRGTYPERLAGGRVVGARPSLPANTVAEFIKERGYSMSSGSYSLLEQGKTLPGDPVAFFSLLCECLAIRENSKYRPLLIAQYMFDVAVRSVGETFAVATVPRGAAALAGLRRQRQQARTRNEALAQNDALGRGAIQRPAVVI